MALIIFCISTVSLGWWKSWNVFSAVPLSPRHWESRCSIGWAANQSLFRPFAAPATQSALFLCRGGSPTVVGPLWVTGDCLRDTVPLACWWNLPHGGHLEDTIWIWILFFTLSQTLWNSMLTIFLPEYIDILVKYCGIRWMENANKSDIIKCLMTRSILVPVQMKKPPGLLKFPCVSWGCGSQRMVSEQHVGPNLQTGSTNSRAAMLHQHRLHWVSNFSLYNCPLSKPSSFPSWWEICVRINSKYFLCDISPYHPCPGCNCSRARDFLFPMLPYSSLC